MDPDNLSIINDERTHRFQVEVEGRTAVLTYRRVGGSLVLDHTEVPPELEGRGIASKLAQAALKYARSQRLQVVPVCPYLAKYLREHAEYQDLLSTANLKHVLGSHE
ncbi:MAG TPA: GNAT family N-acetyltransferase [Terriglobales bacterium]|nr:GNAT family N-acetyltransferase [Terriglobales bacterium]